MLRLQPCRILLRAREPNTRGLARRCGADPSRNWPEDACATRSHRPGFSTKEKSGVTRPTCEFAAPGELTWSKGIIRLAPQPFSGGHEADYAAAKSREYWEVGS
jgi:hypothetical protein